MTLFPRIPWLSKQETDIVQAGPKGPVLSEKGNVAPSLPKVPSPLPVLTGGEVFKSAVASLGLPQDVLSITLLTFARLFSLTPGPDLLASLRKEILASGSSSPKTAKEKAVLEAKTLAAVAASDKGVSLSRESLEAYAGISDNGDFTREHKRREERHHFFWQKDEIETGDLQELFEDSGQNGQAGDLFNLLNRIPGKNGQRWIVWPFDFSAEGTELKVLVRLLIKEPRSNTIAGGGLLIADITGPNRNWHFFLNKSDTGKLEVEITVLPGLAPKDLKALKKETEGFFGSLAAEIEISIRNGEDVPSLVEELGYEALPSINEEV